MVQERKLDSMTREVVVFGGPVVGVVIGLGILLMGTARGGGINELVGSGGVFTLLSVGWLAFSIFRLDEQGQ